MTDLTVRLDAIRNRIEAATQAPVDLDPYPKPWGSDLQAIPEAGACG